MKRENPSTQMVINDFSTIHFYSRFTIDLSEMQELRPFCQYIYVLKYSPWKPDFIERENQLRGIVHNKDCYGQYEKKIQLVNKLKMIAQDRIMKYVYLQVQISMKKI